MKHSHPWRRPSNDAELRAAAAWLRENTDRVYADLGDTVSPRIGGVVDAFGDRRPDLLPGRATRAYDAALPPGERIGLERDQAQVVSALFDSPKLAPHLLTRMREALPESVGYAERFEAEGELVLDTVRIDRRSHYAEITLCNTSTLNAETNQSVRDLEVAVDILTMSKSVSIGVIRGAPMKHPAYSGRRVFSAGINRKDLAAGRISYLEFLIERETGLLAKLARGVVDPSTGKQHSCVWIAVVDAFAIGGGMQLTMVCDHVVVVEDSWFSLPAANEGLVPGLANLRLPRRIGIQLARDMILRGRKLSGQEAFDAGIVDALVPQDSVQEHLCSVALALRGPAIAANRQMLSYGVESDAEFASYLSQFAIVQADRLHAERIDRQTGGAS